VAVTQLENGTWRAGWVVGVGRDGKRLWKYHQKPEWTGAGGKKQAQLYAAAREQEVMLGMYADPDGMTVGEYLRQWLDTYGESNLEQTTLSGYRAYCENHIIPELGFLRLDKLQPMHLQQYITKKLSSGRKDGKPGGLSPTTVRQQLAILHKALNIAVRWQLVARNVADVVDKPRKADHEHSIWTSEQALQFLEACEGHRLYALYWLAITTGMRQGELKGLRWQDVKWQAHHLDLRQQITEDAKGNQIVTTPKQHSQRKVAVTEQDLWVLKKHRALIAEERLQAGSAWSDEWGDLVFPSSVGTPLYRRNIRRHMKQVIRKAGVPDITFHELRHTSATLLLEQGIHPVIVSERLGHSDVSITMNIYQHALPHMQKEAAERLGKALAK